MQLSRLDSHPFCPLPTIPHSPISLLALVEGIGQRLDERPNVVSRAAIWGESLRLRFGIGSQTWRIDKSHMDNFGLGVEHGT